MIWPSILEVKMELRICGIQLKFVSIVDCVNDFERESKSDDCWIGLDWTIGYGVASKSSPTSD